MGIYSRTTCLNCGVEFEFPTRQQRLYCSMPCFQQARGKGKKETLICPVCNRQFTELIAEGRSHCSRKCARVTAATKKGTAPCATCGTEFSYYLTQPHKYCSADCYNKPRQEGKRGTAHCLACKGEFTFLKSWPHQYCSTRCSGKAKIQNIKHFAPSRYKTACQQCGLEYETTPGTSRGMFCSRRCQAKWQSQTRCGEASPTWRGGRVTYYGPNWEVQRRKARKRDKVCLDCGASPDHLGYRLSVHHRIPFRDFGLERYLEANDLSNLMSLCRSCHLIREWADNRSKSVPRQP